jgi:uncharacterized damage-inducible protein DinB
MKEMLLMYARDSERANASVAALIDKLPPEERSRDRKAYYKSLEGLLNHLIGGTTYFLGLLAASLPRLKEFAAKAKGYPEFEKPLTAEEWTDLKAALAESDAAMVALVRSLEEDELTAPIKLDWYQDRQTVPFSFLFSQFFVHGIHHRGQISQILDELGIDHDFSGIDVAFM